MAKFGQIKWGEKPASSNNSKRIDYAEKYLRLEDGKNFLRFVTDPYEYLVHVVKFKNDTPNYKFGRKIRCAGTGCPLCADKKTYPLKTKYVAGVISRSLNKFKLLDFGVQIYNDIVSLQENMPGYNDPREFDINIVRGKPGGTDKMYKVFPGEKKPLSAEDLKLAEEANPEELDNLVKPWTPEELIKSMERIQAWIDKNANGGAASAQQAPVAQEENQTVDDGQYDFNVNRK